MSDKTGIAWTDSTWNPLRGCSKVSAGCANCYAESVASRFSGEGMPYHGLARNGRWTGEVRLVPEKLDQPLRWTKPRRIFVNSMSDPFHEKVSDDDIDHVFAVMALASQHTFQVLTKRPVRMRSYLSAEGLMQRWTACSIQLRARWDRSHGGWSEDFFPRFARHIHLGVSVEDQATADARIPVLLDTPAAVRFVSYEPALAGVDFSQFMWPMHDSWPARFRSSEEARAAGAEVKRHRQALVLADRKFVDWIIVGGESGPRARPCDVAWIRSTVKQCREARVPCFVKQLGALPVGAMSPESEATWGGPVLNCDWKLRIRHRAGADPAEWPEDLRLQRFRMELAATASASPAARSEP